MQLDLLGRIMVNSTVEFHFAASAIELSIPASVQKTIS